MPEPVCKDHISRQFLLPVSPSDSHPRSEILCDNFITVDSTERTEPFVLKSISEFVQEGPLMPEIQEPETFFKFVAVDDAGRYVSIFDGKTEYRVGEPINQEVRPGHKGGIYVCESLLDLLKLGPMPSQSAMMNSTWAVAKVVGWGTRLDYNQDVGGNKIALSHCVPTQFVRFSERAKSRYLARGRRMTASAVRQRQGGVNMKSKPLKLTLEETQQVFQDWQHLIGEFEEDT